jgi:hypothetical protein
MTTTMQMPDASIAGKFWEPIESWGDYEKSPHNDLPPYNPYWYRSEESETHLKKGFSYADAASGRTKSPDKPAETVVPKRAQKIPEFPTLTEASRIHSVDGELTVKQPEPIAPPSKKKIVPAPQKKRKTKNKKTRPVKDDTDDFDILDEAIKQRRQEAHVYSTSLYERREDLMPPCVQVLNVFIIIYARTLPEHKKINEILGRLCLPSNDKNKATIERAVLSRFLGKSTNAELWAALEESCRLRGRKYDALRTAITTGDYHMASAMPVLKE